MENDLMMPQEVANMFRVNLSTVLRWGQQGLIERVELPTRGKRPHYRYVRASVEYWLTTVSLVVGKAE